MQFSLHPNVYSTGQLRGLRAMLENVWVRDHEPGDGVFYLVSGFANFNGGARFYRTFREHVDAGGQIKVFLGGSPSQRLSSKQVVEALLESGAEVTVINRKRLLHAKCYGAVTSHRTSLVVTSGNFTGPGMSQNLETSVLLENEMLTNNNFSWDALVSQMEAQNWLSYPMQASAMTGPGWRLLYDEIVGAPQLDLSEQVTAVVVLGHADTARIQADPGSRQGLGSQYFWLSKDMFDFFPPLTIRNMRGIKGTLSTMVTLHYMDLGVTKEERVTFEAENNLDFRLGTGELRYTKLADRGDVACITRIAEAEYELRILKPSNPYFDQLSPYATTFIGHQGKRYGFIDNEDFEDLTNIRPGAN